MGRELIQDLSQYDVIGLQTQIDQNACMQTCLNLLEAQKIQSNNISYKKRQILIKSYPIGVQPEIIQKQAQQDLAISSVFNFEEIPRQKQLSGLIVLIIRKACSKDLMHLQPFWKPALNIMA